MLALLLAATLAAQVPDSAHLVLVATTDVHGHATAWDYLAHRPFPGGLPRVATVVDSLRRRYPGQVVVLDAGDLLQGSPFASYYARAGVTGLHPIIEAMNLVGYDAATLGNHDFDRGLPALFDALRDAAYPYVSANIQARPGDTPMFRPYRVVQRQGVRVGIAGFTTPGVMVWDRDRLRGKMRVVPIAQAAPGALAGLRRESDFAVVLVHSGLGGASSYDTTGVGSENAAATLAELPTRPDVVVVGHTHQEIRDTAINGVRFVQPRPFGGQVAVVHVDLARRRGTWQVLRIRTELLDTRSVAPSPLLEQRLAASHDSVQAWVDQPLGLAAAPMRSRAARVQPTPIMDFVLETERRRAGTQLASGPAYDLQAGFTDTVRRADVLRLYPFDNTLRAIRISGAQLRAYLEWSARYFLVDPAGRISINDSVPGYDFDLVRGARYQIDLRRPVGDRIQGLSVGGRPVAPGDSFTLALNSHRQTGAGGYAMLRGAPVVYDKGEGIPELLEVEVARGGADPAARPPSQWGIGPEVARMAVRNLFGVAPPPLARSAADTVTFRLVASADLHEELPVVAGGVERAMDSLGAECGCPGVRLDAGGSLHGSPVGEATGGRAAVKLLDAMGYTAAIPGEREFDWPLDTLRQRTGETRFPWIASNLIDTATGRRPTWLAPYRMIDTAGIRIAVLGYVAPETKLVQPAERTAGLRFGEGELALHEALTEVRAARPGLTVLLADAGATCDSVTCVGEVVRLAEQLGGSGVDLIIAGRSPRPFQTRVAGIAIVAPGGPGAVAVADLVKTPAGGREIRVRAEPVAAGPARPGSELAGVLRSLGQLADSMERRVVARLKRPLDRAGPQFALGALLAEARRNAGRADLGLVRNASIRSGLPAGVVTWATLRTVEPAGAALVEVTLTGAQLRDLAERVVGDSTVPSAHLAGAEVRYDPRAPRGRRTRRVELAGERKLRPGESYTLVTDDATAAGAGGLLPDGLAAVRLGLTEVEATAAYLRRLPQPVEASAAVAFQSTRP